MIATVVSLLIGGTKVTDDGLRHLAGIPTLTAVNLADLPITEKGLARLGEGCKPSSPAPDQEPREGT